jgi:hypothetical protein
MTSVGYKFGIVPLSMVLFTLTACDSINPLSSGGNTTQTDIQQPPGDSSPANISTLTSTATATPTPAVTSTATPTLTPTSTATPTPTPTPTPTVTSTATLSTKTTTPTQINSGTPKPTTAATTNPKPFLPQEFEGQWTSVGQGDAETSYRFHRDGSYEKASILLQHRSNGGNFSFVITASGSAAIYGNLLTLTPTEGTQAMEDPDAPSRNFNKPLTDLTQDEFLWAFQDGQLILSSDLGSVPYTRDPDK